jgi:hypothetical protein
VFVFGHIGIGRGLARPWIHRLPAVPLIVGTLLPDLIDKPLYYARISPFISCTRTFGHTGIFLAALTSVALVRRSRVVGALAVGVATHLLLDGLVSGFGRDPQHSAWLALTWPFLQRSFAEQFTSMANHLRILIVMQIVAAEIAGLALIAWELRAKQTSSGD